MIVTCKKEIPFRWMLLAMLPWSAVTIASQVSGNAVVFSLKKFLENPAALTFVLSLPAFLSLIVITITNFLSDRIWTPYGRRKPFILIGFGGTAVCFFLMPLMPNFWSLVAVYILLGVFMDLNSPIEPLKQEIVPPHQRGRATGVMFWINQAAQLTFMFFIFGRFDDVTFMGGLPITGEMGIYWSAGLIAIAMLFVVALGIKEVKPHSQLTGERLSLKTFFGGLTDREILPVYILIFGSAVLNASTGPLGALLYTEQWGYTKQDMGTNIAIGGVLNLFLIVILTLIADKLNRLRAYQVLIVLAITLNISYYSYVHFVLPDRRPSLFEMVLFGEMMSVVGILTGLIFTPLIYDYVVRNKMGTYVAGAQLVNRLTAIITANGAGLFIVGYAALVQPPAGEMTRVVLKDPADRATVSGLLATSPLTNPATSGPATIKDLHVDIWNADGTVEKSGRGIELRFRNETSEKLAAERRALTDTLNPLLEEQRLLTDRETIARNNGDTAETTRLSAQLESLRPRIADLQTQIDTINTSLRQRSESFRDQITRTLAPHLTEAGSQIIDSGPAKLHLLTVDLAAPISRERLEKLLVFGRAVRPDLVDIKMGADREHLEISLLADPTMPAMTQAQQAVKAIAQAGASLTRGALDPSSPISSLRDATGLRLTLATVESPVPERLSPVTAALHAIQRWLGMPLAADARVLAAGRALRDPQLSPHASARPASGNAREITLIVLPGTQPEASPKDDAITKSIQRHSASTPELTPALRALYDRSITALAKQSLTVREPVLSAEYVPVKYDYMAGNLLTIALGFVGFAITMVFYRLERKGLIRKRGVEEAMASE